MHSANRLKLSLLAVAASSALAACGGGGGGGGDTAAATPTPTPVATGPTTPTQAGQLPIVTAPTTPGATTRTPPAVPPQNALEPFVGGTTYAVANEGPFKAFTLTNIFRREGQGDVDLGGTVEGAGAVNQSEALDQIAAQVSGALAANAALPDWRAAAATAGFVRSFVTSFDPKTVRDSNDSILPLITSDICVKAMFASVSTVEELMFGYRSIGLSVPMGQTGSTTAPCVLTIGLDSLTKAQLPPTGAVTVYPYPGKDGTLRQMFGTLNEPNVPVSAGHPIFASVASVDALPVDGLTPGGTAVPGAEVILREFVLRKGGTVGQGEVVGARVLAANGVNISGVQNAQSSANIKFPTSFVLVPTAALDADTEYNVTFNATVRGFSTCVTSSQTNRTACQSQSWTFKTGAI